jgi:Putative prokaryotic signal transducing protein
MRQAPGNANLLIGVFSPLANQEIGVPGVFLSSPGVPAMSDKLVFVAAFNMPVEAQLARGLLEADEIKAFLTGGESVNVFSGVQGLGGQIRLQVADADAERAAAILAPHFDHHPDDDGAESGDHAALWLCPLCGDAVGNDLDVCPACETPRPAARESLGVTAIPRRRPVSQEIQEEPAVKPEKFTSDEPLEAAQSALDGDIDVPDMETLVGDDLVRRAFFSSLFGVLSPYSIWLLGQLAFYQGKISPRLMPRLYWAIAIDACWLLFLLVFFAQFFVVIYRFR